MFITFKSHFRTGELYEFLFHLSSRWDSSTDLVGTELKAKAVGTNESTWRGNYYLVFTGRSEKKAAFLQTTQNLNLLQLFCTTLLVYLSKTAFFFFHWRDDTPVLMKFIPRGGNSRSRRVNRWLGLDSIKLEKIEHVRIEEFEVNKFLM